MFLKTKLLIKSCLVASLTAVSLPLMAETSLFKVSNQEHVVYLFGTMHVLPASAWPLQESITQAFDLADIAVFEIDDMDNPAAAQKMMQNVKLPDNQPLSSQLSKETYQALTVFLEQNQMPISAYESFKPWFIASAIGMQEFSKMGYFPNFGADMKLQKMAEAQEMQTIGLETIEYQLGLFDQLDEIDADMMISQTLNDLSDINELAPQLLATWQQGDLETMDELFIQPMAEYPEMLEMLLTKRNHNWMPEIESMLNTAPVEFIAVGAAHLAGETGLLKLLADKGYVIEQQ